MATFAELGISKNYIKSIKELGIVHPTEIQRKAIPVLLESKTDFIGLAQTGTGKTAAYGLPLLHHVSADQNAVQCLILSPTRELVQQIKKQLFKYTKYVEYRIFVEAVFGGEKIDRQIKNLQRTTHVIVATPGRLIELIERGVVDLRSVKTIVLDEADEMLSMGFKQDLNHILKFTKKSDRSIWLFSATMPEEIKRIVKTYMNSNAPRIQVNENAIVNTNIRHQFFTTSIKNKTDDIITFLETRNQQRGIIFCRTKAGAQKLAKELVVEGFSTAAIEGDMQQKERDKVMRAFKNENLQFLISTDVSARGIDVKDLDFVIHFQLPEKIEYYTHRSGRTARAGKSGTSIAFIIPSELPKIHEIQKALQIKFTEIS